MLGPIAQFLEYPKTSYTPIFKYTFIRRACPIPRILRGITSISISHIRPRGQSQESSPLAESLVQETAVTFKDPYARNQLSPIAKPRLQDI